MKILKLCSLLSLFIILLFSCQPNWIKKAPKYNYSGMDRTTKKVHKKVEKFLARAVEKKQPVYVHPATRIEEIRVDKEARYLEIRLNKRFAFIPFRETNVENIYTMLRKDLGRKYKKYKIVLYTLDHPIEQLIPNLYRTDTETLQKDRMIDPQIPRPLPVVSNSSKPFKPQKGLYNHNVALWHSHGWYYDHNADRWEWQRPRLFQTVEDLLPMSFTLPYIIPMLENAGANVFIPRERDTQINEIIVDNDSIAAPSQLIAYSENRSAEQQTWFSGKERAFAIGTPPYGSNINPFRQGTHRYTLSTSQETAYVDWIPSFPEQGYYNVYISYVSSEENVDDARYSVYHSGGKTDFVINQQIGGRTWIYLGNFHFEKGFSEERGKVRLSNKSSQAGKRVSADAVRFGGGMGIIERRGSTSGRPKFVEASRYYLQYAGFPDSLVYDTKEGNSDYIDDYQSRPEYVNYLHGAPYGPTKNRSIEGLGIPIDLSLAFHTDAGVTDGDSTIGTLSIYSLTGADTLYLFPDSLSRLANRDFADIMQTQIVDDVRAKFDPNWCRRILMDGRYSEAFRPNVPSALLELLSHQNFYDMQFALDPRFRFHTSRSIYKSMLKFINQRHGKDFVVQPLPVTHFRTEITENSHVNLSWLPGIDPLEPSAVADAYIVYKAENNGGFDNGVLTKESEYVFDSPEKGIIYRFKITAVNQGGESFPSEELAACVQDTDNNPVLVVNGFDRICGPYSFRESKMAGFVQTLDNGVPDHYDLNFTGTQHDYNPGSVFIQNDAPGFGSSYGDFETTIIPGNSFDFPAIHGESIRNAGYSFVSASDEALMDDQVGLARYRIIDLILGEEKATPWQRSSMDTVIGVSFKTFPEKLKRKIRQFSEGGGNILISGAYVGTDLFSNRDEVYPDVVFARETLKFNWVTNYGARKGLVYSTGDSIFKDIKLQFNTGYHPEIYTVEAPDAIKPAKGALTIFRYDENKFSAATAYNGEYKMLVFGFPFETIIKPEDRDLLMAKSLFFFTRDK